uniref:Uncharacterized protein n=1 Tax=Anguilla anguilla TaxID=7936 RepID=A0A0E9PAY0_ANGAN
MSLNSSCYILSLSYFSSLCLLPYQGYGCW